MKQDINKLIEELTKARPDELSTEGLKLFNKINEIIDKNKELEEENRIFALEGNRVGLKIHIDKNYIPVSLVEETIEELNKKLNNGGKKYGGCVINPENIMKLESQIDVLQELLERRKYKCLN